MVTGEGYLSTNSRWYKKSNQHAGDSLILRICSRDNCSIHGHHTKIKNKLYYTTRSKRERAVTPNKGTSILFKNDALNTPNNSATQNNRSSGFQPSVNQHAEFPYKITERKQNKALPNHVGKTTGFSKTKGRAPICHGRLASRDKEGDNTLEHGKLKELHLLK